MNINLIATNEDVNSGLVIDNFLSPFLQYRKKTKNTTVIKIFNVNSIWKRSENMSDHDITKLKTYVTSRVFELFFPSVLIFIFASILTGLRISYYARNQTRPLFVFRGYHGICIALTLKVIFYRTGKIVFDPRSLYIEESIHAKRLKSNSLAVRFWKFLEKMMLKASLVVLCVGDAQSEHYKEILNRDIYHIIPFSGENLVFTACRPYTRKADVEYVQGRLNLSAGTKLCLYYGSLDYGWNNISYYKSFIKNNNNWHFIFLTQSCKLARTHLGHFDNVHIFSMDTISEVVPLSVLLNACDYGLCFLGPAPDWKTRLGVKFAFYAVNGIPVLLTNYVGEAVTVSERLGFRCVEVIPFPKISAVHFPTNYSDIDREHLALNAREYFSFSKLEILLKNLD